MTFLYRFTFILSMLGLFLFLIIGTVYIYNILSKKGNSPLIVKSLVYSFSGYLTFFVLSLVVQYLGK